MSAAMPHVLRQCDLAHYAGVGRAAARNAMRGKLKPAQNEDGSRVYSAHPLVQAYIHSTHGGRQRKLRAGVQQNLDAAATSDVATPAEDPFMVAMANAAGAPALPSVQRSGDAPSAAPPPVFNIGVLRAKRTDAVLFDLHTNTAGQLPADVKDLGAMTLREVVDIFGGLQALSDAVKALKHFADMKVREVDASKKRGDLVDRKLLTAVLMPLIELAFKRLVGEVPGALGVRVIARAISGGVDTKNDVEGLIREENSGVLESMRDSIVMELEKIDEEAHD